MNEMEDDVHGRDGSEPYIVTDDRPLDVLAHQRVRVAWPAHQGASPSASLGVGGD